MTQVTMIANAMSLMSMRVFFAIIQGFRSTRNSLVQEGICSRATNVFAESSE
jgi:hypothetical protein